MLKGIWITMKIVAVDKARTSYGAHSFTPTHTIYRTHLHVRHQPCSWHLRGLQGWTLEGYSPGTGARCLARSSVAEELRSVAPWRHGRCSHSFWAPHYYICKQKQVKSRSVSINLALKSFTHQSALVDTYWTICLYWWSSKRKLHCWHAACEVNKNTCCIAWLKHPPVARTSLNLTHRTSVWSWFRISFESRNNVILYTAAVLADWHD